MRVRRLGGCGDDLIVVFSIIIIIITIIIIIINESPVVMDAEEVIIWRGVWCSIASGLCAS